ncbi:MAG: hypothetical protein J0L94_12610 [Rhodothermia bacterium]|nr:hypothetical protein [Rhodothermia bacterium]
MFLCLFEDAFCDHLRPVVEARAVFDIRLGSSTIAQYLRRQFPDLHPAFQVRPYLAGTLAEAHAGVLVNETPSTGTLFLNGRISFLPAEVILRLRKAAQTDEPKRLFMQDGFVVAAWIPDPTHISLHKQALSPSDFNDAPLEAVEGVHFLNRLWHMLVELPDFISRGFGQSGNFGKIHPSAILVEPNRIFVAEGAIVHAGAILAADTGPIILDRGAEICEGAVVKGPCYIGQNSRINMTARIDTTAIGPGCKIGGEVHASTFQANSNKAHDGYVGNSYIGQWCNLGADSNTSNLKNDYGNIRLYNVALQRYELSGQQFLGTIMGDHTKCGINTMFNTGTVIGTFCNLYGGGYQRNYVSSFSWGSPAEMYMPYKLEKALRVAEAVFSRRNKRMSESDLQMLETIYRMYHDLAMDMDG